MPTNEYVNLFYSGGPSNRDPSKSIGGSTSTTVVWEDYNNLFDNVDSNDFFIDYRCLYFKNFGPQISNIQFYCNSEDVLLGIQQNNDVQQFSIKTDNGLSGGAFDFSFYGTDASVSYDSDLSVFSNNFSNAILGIGYENNITPLIYYYTTGGWVILNLNEWIELTLDDWINIMLESTKVFYVFNIEIIGSTLRPTIIPGSNTLVGSNISLECIKIQDGSPVNKTAQLLSSPYATPKEVEFQRTSEDIVISLDSLDTDEFFPIWIKRIIPEYKLQVNDFTINISGDTS